MPTNDLHRFQMLMRKQLAVQEGIGLLKQNQLELAQVAATGRVFGLAAIIGRAIVVPLNVIVNAGQLGTAKTALQVLGTAIADAAYKKHGASGTGLKSDIRSWEGVAKNLLGGLKIAIGAELKRKGATAYIPGANVLVGLSEDSLALLSAAKTVSDGDREVRVLTQRLQQQLTRMELELVKFGMQANQHLERMQVTSRTA